MKQIYLLQDYQENNKGDIISVSNNVAFGLIDSGIGKESTTRDFIVKPEFGISKAFKKAPSKRVYRKRK